MAAKLQKAHSAAKVDLIKGKRGVFTVTVDGREVWNKHEMGDEFPNEDKLVASIKDSG